MDYTTYIKEIGRGRHAARSLARSDALALARAILAGEVPDLELGAVLLAFRMKGESPDEIAGFAEAAHEVTHELQAPAGDAAPVIVPAYNGARKLPNLTPLLACALATRGLPVLVHGVREDPGRVTTREVFAAMGVAPAVCMEEASTRLAREGLAFVPIDVLAPPVARVLGYRRVLGVRNTLHSVVKLLQPFAGPALRIVSVTHPDYLALMREHFAREGGHAQLLRGAEGEAVASVRRSPDIEWWHDGGKVDSGMVQPAAEGETALPGRDASDTARWIARVLSGELPMPATIAYQIELAQRAARSLRATKQMVAPS